MIETPNIRFRRAILFGWLVVFVVGGCATATKPGVAVLELRVDPNPIEAERRWGEIWEFPFTVILRETNGVDVTIDRVSIEVLLSGTIVHREEIDGTELESLGFDRRLAGGGEVRYSFRPERFIPHESLIRNVEADLEVRGTDSGGRRVVTRYSVSLSVKTE